MGNEASHSVNYGKEIPNDVKLTWKKVAHNGKSTHRDGHAACSVGESVFVFGGVTKISDEDCSELNDLIRFSPESNKWEILKSTGDVPAARSAAVLSAVDNTLYLFGGLSRNVGWFNDMYSFNIENNRWKRLDTDGISPSGRDKLAAAVIGKDIYYFGGFGPKSAEEDLTEGSDDEDEEEGAEFGWFNDIFVFNTETNTWSQPMQMNMSGPTPRAALGMTAVGKDLVIFGGRDIEKRRNDLHIFDTETRKWRTDLTVTGRYPEPRSFHTLSTVDKRVVLFGGRGLDNQHFNDIHILDTDKLEWLQPKISEVKPEERGCHITAITDSQLLIHGGSSNFDSANMQCGQYYNDTYSIDLDDIKQGSAIKEEEQVCR